MKIMKISEWADKLLKAGVGAEYVSLTKKCIGIIIAFDKAIFPNNPPNFCIEKDNEIHTARYCHDVLVEVLGVRSDVYGVNPYNIQRDLKWYIDNNYADAIAFLLEVDRGVVPPERDYHVSGDYNIGRIVPMTADQAMLCIAAHEVRHRVQQLKRIRLFSPTTKFPKSDKQSKEAQRMAKQITDVRKRKYDARTNYGAEFDAHFIEICVSCLIMGKPLFDKEGRSVVGDDLCKQILGILIMEPST